MDFARVIEQVCGRLDVAGIRYALIGGFAMALRGVQRATMDLDFILMLEDMGKADAILSEFGYRRDFHSENVSHYRSSDQEWGRIDILHAFRGPALGMLQRAERIPVDASLTLPVVHVEDLVGLKIQALVNDPLRAISDWDDKTERAQLKKAVERRALPPRPARQVSLRSYMEFAAFAARFDRSAKPVRFTGEHWKL